MTSTEVEPLEILICGCCGGEMPWSGRGRPPSYCSKLCRLRAAREAAPKQEPKRYTPNCASCGVQFEASRSHARFCSGACRVRAHDAARRGTEAGEAARERGVERQRTRRREALAQRPPLVCRQCGETFAVKAGYVRPYCSRSCRSRAEYLASLEDGRAEVRSATRREVAASKRRRCSGCARPLRYARDPEPRCRGCRRSGFSPSRRRAMARAAKAARGRRGRAPFVSGRCARCGEWFVGRPNGTRHAFCSRRCLARERTGRRRALEAGVRISRVRRFALYERDGWVCHLCGGPVDASLLVPEGGAATLDHVVPLARGGDHAEFNLRLAHFICNSRKGASIGVGLDVPPGLKSSLREGDVCPRAGEGCGCASLCM